MTLPTDDEMMAALAQTREYTVVLLKAGPAYDTDDAPAIVREHGRRNFALRADGSLNIVCPVLDDSDLHGVGIFARSLDQTREIMDGDPGVQAGVFVYEMHLGTELPRRRTGLGDGDQHLAGRTTLHGGVSGGGILEAVAM